MRRARLALVLAAALAGCPKERSAVTPPGPPALAPGEPITIQVVHAVVAEVVPLVEAAAGRPFDEVPFAGLGTPESLEAINLEDHMTILRAIHPELPDLVVHRMARAMSAHTGGLVGKYAMGGKGRLYVAAASLDGMVERGDLEPEERLDALRLVLAHELVHGLQDEALGGMEVFTRAPTLDGLQVSRALTEGQAMWVEERVAAELGLEALFWRQVEDGQGWGRDGLAVPQAFDVWWAYGQGRATMAWHGERGGAEAIWRVMEAPPATSAAILWPDWSAAPHQVDLSGALEGMEADLTGGAWLAQEGDLGAYHLAGATAGLDSARLREPLEHVVGARVREALREDRSAEAWVLRFDDPAWARALVELVPDAAAAREALVAAAMEAEAPGIGAFEDVVTPWEDLPETMPADLAWYRVAAPAGPHSSDVESASVWMLRGDTVVRLGVTGFRPGLRWGRALEGIWARLEDPDPTH